MRSHDSHMTQMMHATVEVWHGALNQSYATNAGSKLADCDNQMTRTAITHMLLFSSLRQASETTVFEIYPRIRSLSNLACHKTKNITTHQQLWCMDMFMIHDIQQQQQQQQLLLLLLLLLMHDITYNNNNSNIDIWHTQQQIWCMTYITAITA